MCVQIAHLHPTRDPWSVLAVLGFEPALSPYPGFISAGAAKLRYLNPGRAWLECSAECMHASVTVACCSFEMLARIGMRAYTSHLHE